MLFGYFNEDKKIEEKKEETALSAISTVTSEKTKKQQEDARHKRENSGIIVKGADNLLIRVSKCCNPVPGDEIIGFITKGRGISVHRADCANVLTMPEEEKKRFIEVEWDHEKLGKSYDADICIVAYDRKGLFSDISKVCEDMNVKITGVNARSLKDETVNITMTVSISNTSQMQKVLRSLKNVPSVTEVFRAAV